MKIFTTIAHVFFVIADREQYERTIPILQKVRNAGAMGEYDFKWATRSAVRQKSRAFQQKDGDRHRYSYVSEVLPDGTILSTFRHGDIKPETESADEFVSGLIGHIACFEPEAERIA